MAGAVRIEHGDCLDVLERMAAGGIFVDGCVTDPPYHLASIVSRLGSPGAAPIQSGATGVYARGSAGFMGQKWDGGDIAFQVETWRRVFAVLRPGAHLVAFAATKGYHRMACAVEDAGFEVRDSILNIVDPDEPVRLFMESLSRDQLEAFFRCIEESEFGGLLAWVFGTGFPKPHNLDGEYEGWSSALKPAFEPILLARKPLLGSIPANMLLFGTGAINIDGCRVPIGDEIFDGGGQSRNGVRASTHHEGYRRPWMSDPEAVAAHQSRLVENIERARKLGRWPANVVHDGSAAVIRAFPESDGARAAVKPSSGRKTQQILGNFKENSDSTPRGDSGSAARFFYSAKATGGERIFECRQCGAHTIGRPDCGHDPEKFRTHPTVKPIDLMRWLVRLIMPPGGLVLDPFAGTGTTGAAARAEGMDTLLIEQDPDHVRDCCVRLGISIDEAQETPVQGRAVNQSSCGPLFA